MKLEYVWIYNYRNFIKNQEFNLTGDLKIKSQYDEKSNTLKIKVEDNDRKSLYKGNIIDISAIVGRNGSGKTTMAKMLMDYMPSINIILNEDKDIFNIDNKERIERAVWIFSTEENYNKKILIFSRNVNVVKNTTIQSKVIYDFEETFKQLKNVHIVYLSNVFNAAELRNDYYERNIKESEIQVQQMYTPAMILKSSSDKFRKMFGYRTNDNNYLRTIHRYAENMSSSIRLNYLKRQEELFLNCYSKVSQEVRDELSIFNNYDLQVADFKAYEKDMSQYWDYEKCDFKKEFRNLDEIEQVLIEAQRIYSLLKARLEKGNNKSMWLKIYIVLLAEVYMGTRGGENRLSHEIDIYANMSSETGELKELNEIDEYMLNKIKNALNGNKALSNLPWKDQILDCINQIKKYYFGKGKVWSLRNRDFYDEQYPEEEKGIIDWYQEESKKQNSFFRRYVYFNQSPTSSGEVAFANLYAYIYDAVKGFKKDDEVILIIDEADAYMHPKWQQMLIKKLITYLDSFKDYKFQIIITTHSPIILSDILDTNICFIEKGEDGCLQVIENQSRTFGNNIYNLYKDGFFLDGSNYGIMGDFAAEKINEVSTTLSSWSAKIEEIYNMPYESNLNYYNDDVKVDTPIKRMLEEYKEKANTELIACKQIIDSIGEKVIREMLLKQYNSIYKQFNDVENEDTPLNNLKSSFDSLSKKEQNELIKYIIRKRGN